jgi:hypothetical protein
MCRFTHLLMNLSWRNFLLNIVANKRVRYYLHVFGEALVSVRKSFSVPEVSLFFFFFCLKRQPRERLIVSVEFIRLSTCVGNVTNV